MVIDISAFYSNWNASGEKEVRIDMEVIKSRLGVFPIVKKEPFRLHLENVENKRLLIQGETDVTVSIPCDRCLSEVPVRLHLVIDKELPIEVSEGISTEEKPSETQDGDDDNLEQLEYMNGCQLDADRLAYGEMLFAWPAKVLCKDDCRGICPECGANRNESSCQCEQPVPDLRMAAFQDVFNKFKEV